MGVSCFEATMNKRKLFCLFGAILTWISLALQYWLILGSGEHASFGAATLYFFGFFTILTNIIVGLAFTAPLLKPNTRLHSFFTKPAVRAAIALYILVVAVVYHVMLADIHDPVGLGVLTNIALHTAIPALYCLDWILFARKTPMLYKHIPVWIIYPLVYGLLNIVRGLITGFYPYPFIDMMKLGVQTVSLNMLGFTALYAVGAALFITLSKALSTRENPTVSTLQ